MDAIFTTGYDWGGAAYGEGQDAEEEEGDDDYDDDDTSLLSPGITHLFPHFNKSM